MPRFDFKGFVLSGVGLLSLISGVSAVGRGIAPFWLVVAMIAIGALSLAAYVRHAGGNEDAILDLKLLKIPTFFAGVIGGFVFRIGIGAMPFLLPLLLQLGFGLTPFQSGSLTFATAAGALLMKFTASTALRWFGFRSTLIVNGLISGAFLAACALFTPLTPHWLLLITLLAGGFFRSLEFTALNAISYADIDQPRMSRATSFASVSQQMSGAVGVAVAAICVELIQLGFGDPALEARDLSLAFVLVAIISSLSVFIFVQAQAGRGRRSVGQARSAGESRARGGGISAAAGATQALVRRAPVARRCGARRKRRPKTLTRPPRAPCPAASLQTRVPRSQRSASPKWRARGRLRSWRRTGVA